MTLREGAIEAIISSGESNPMSPYPEEVLMRQSTALLPFEFDRLLDSNTANGDAFYALHYVFEHAAYSEVQVLNIIEAQLEEEMGVLTIERHRSHSLEDLHFLSMFLDRHVHQISETLRTIREKGHSTWPAKSDKGGTTSSARKGLEEDFEDLLARAVELRRRCTEGMGIMMNRAVVAESRKAIEQNERLKRLTLLASFFIPLSFTTSLFGMNFVEFGQGKQPLWLFAAVSVPVLMLSYCAYVWDDIWSPLRRIVVTWARRYFKIRRQAPRRDHDA